MSLSFELLASDGAARRGRIATAHGTVETPAFMPLGTAVLTAVKSLLSEPGLEATTLTPTTRAAAIRMRTMDGVWLMPNTQLVQPALEAAQDVHLLTVEVVKREELGEVKLPILKEGNDNVCLECRDGHAHYTTPE